ncbi:MAG TPA: S8 family serine peptidase [Chroococcales cyanobacterium]
MLLRKKKVTFTAFSILLATTLSACQTSPANLKVGEAHPGVQFLSPPAEGIHEIVVQFKDGHRSIQGVDTVRNSGHTAVVKVPDGQTLDETLKKVRADQAVAIAEPNYKYHAYYTPNDPMFDQLWGIKKIQAPEAWDSTMGDPSITVAVVDSGVDYNHPDLAGKVIKGPDTANNDSDPMDDVGHGTHVAGTIAAIGDNKVGVIGIAPKTKILAIKVLGANGEGDVSTIAEGILKAQQMGARVINLSLGGPQNSSVLQNAIDQVTQKGVMVIAAAGNDGVTTPDYPASYPNVLAVGATDSSDKKTSFSNYGTYVGIAAPGLNILSSTGGSYKSMSGTSMACPHVVGAAALLLGKNPNLTIAQLRNALVSTGDPVSGFSAGVKRLNVFKALNSITGGGTNPATPAPVTPPTPAPGNLAITNVALSSLGSTDATITWSTSAPADSFMQYTPSYYYRHGYWWTSKDASMVTTHQLHVQSLKAGTTYYLKLKSKDEGGHEVESGFYGFQTRS